MCNTRVLCLTDAHAHLRSTCGHGRVLTPSRPRSRSRRLRTASSWPLVRLSQHSSRPPAFPCTSTRVGGRLATCSSDQECWRLSRATSSSSSRLPKLSSSVITPPSRVRPRLPSTASQTRSEPFLRRAATSARAHHSASPWAGVQRTSSYPPPQPVCSLRARLRLLHQPRGAQQRWPLGPIAANSFTASASASFTSTSAIASSPHCGIRHDRWG